MIDGGGVRTDGLGAVRKVTCHSYTWLALTRYLLHYFLLFDAVGGKLC
jgi:hypothetical protein